MWYGNTLHLSNVLEEALSPMIDGLVKDLFRIQDHMRDMECAEPNGDGWEYADEHTAGVLRRDDALSIAIHFGSWTKYHRTRYAVLYSAIGGIRHLKVAKVERDPIVNDGQYHQHYSLDVLNEHACCHHKMKGLYGDGRDAGHVLGIMRETDLYPRVVDGKMAYVSANPDNPQTINHFSGDTTHYIGDITKFFDEVNHVASQIPTED